MCVDPNEYYEDVAPSDWKAETPESCTELHRRAYCGHADAAFPVLFIALVGLVCSLQLLSPWLLLVALPVVFVLGLQLLVVSGQCLGLFLLRHSQRCRHAPEFRIPGSGDSGKPAADHGIKPMTSCPLMHFVSTNLAFSNAI